MNVIKRHQGAIDIFRLRHGDLRYRIRTRRSDLRVVRRVDVGRCRRDSHDLSGIRGGPQFAVRNAQDAAIGRQVDVDGCRIDAQHHVWVVVALIDELRDRLDVGHRVVTEHRYEPETKARPVDTFDCETGLEMAKCIPDVVSEGKRMTPGHTRHNAEFVESSVSPGNQGRNAVESDHTVVHGHIQERRNADHRTLRVCDGAAKRLEQAHLRVSKDFAQTDENRKCTVAVDRPARELHSKCVALSLDGRLLSTHIPSVPYLAARFKSWRLGSTVRRQLPATCAT